MHEVGSIDFVFLIILVYQCQITDFQKEYND